MTPPNPPPKVPALDRLLRTAAVVVPLGVLGNLGFSLATTDRALLTSLGQFPRGYLLLAAVLALVPWFTNALRLHIWTDFIGHPLGLREALRIQLATELGSAVTPTASGGGLFKWGMLVQRGVSPGAAASIAALVVAEDTLFFGVAIPLGFLVSAAWRLPILRGVLVEARAGLLEVLLIGAGSLLVLWLVWRAVLLGHAGRRARWRTLRLLAGVRHRVRGGWRDAGQVYRLIARRGKARFALSFGLTAIQWICRYSVISALVAFLGAPVYPVLYFVFQWVIFTLMNLVPTPGAAGGAEAAFFLIYGTMIPSRIMGLATAGWRFFTFYLPLVFAAILFPLLGLWRGRPAGFRATSAAPTASRRP